MIEKDFETLHGRAHELVNLAAALLDDIELMQRRYFKKGRSAA